MSVSSLQMSNGIESVCAVVVIFHPNEGFLDNLESVVGQVDCVLVVDNGSHGSATKLLCEAIASGRVHLIQNEKNRGVASALNQGFSWAIDRGYGYILTMDQDSTPEAGMVEMLLDVYQRCPSSDRIAIVAPRIEDPSIPGRTRFLRPRGRFLFERSPCAGEWLEGVSTVITSGALHSLAVYQEIGGFREDFFIDYVDTDYCLRARMHGYEIVVACHARMYHRWGNRKRKVFLGVSSYPTFHSPERWYYIYRNRLPMIRMYARQFPHWLAYEIIMSSYWLLRMILMEDRRREKIAAALKGLRDGLAGNLGAGPLAS